MINRVSPYEETCRPIESEAADSEPALSKWKDRLEPVRRRILTHPREAMIVSVLIGVTIGWLLKRR